MWTSGHQAYLSFPVSQRLLKLMSIESVMPSSLILCCHDAGKDCGQAEKEMMEEEMLDNVTDSMDMSLSKRWEIVKDREAWHAAIHEVIKSQTQSN